MPRMAAQDPPDAAVTADEDPVFLEAANRILGAGWREAARWP